MPKSKCSKNNYELLQINSKIERTKTMEYKYYLQNNILCRYKYDNKKGNYNSFGEYYNSLDQTWTSSINAMFIYENALEEDFVPKSKADEFVEKLSKNKTKSCLEELNKRFMEYQNAGHLGVNTILHKQPITGTQANDVPPALAKTKKIVLRKRKTQLKK